MDIQQLSNTIALTMGVGWASGINLYAAILVLGILGITGNIDLPPDLQVLQNPLVLGAAGIMYAAEFFADKIPGIDTGWDSIHTFIRIPAGVLLAAGAVGEMNTAVVLAAGIMGGGLAAGSHATKSGSRVMINTSPEPFTNWTVSVTEDVAVIAGLWAALHHPYIFLILMGLFILLMIWLLPKLWRGIRKVFGFLGRLIGIKPEEETVTNYKRTTMKTQQKTNNIKQIILTVTFLILAAAPLSYTAYAEHGHDTEPAFRVGRLLISESIREREPIGATKVFSSSLEKVYCFLDARDIKRDTFISFVWYYNDKAVARVTLPVRKGTRWRTYSSKRLAGLKGDWKVEIKDSDETVIKEVKFIVE
jgi:hypothetical protein